MSGSEVIITSLKRTINGMVHGTSCLLNKVYCELNTNSDSVIYTIFKYLCAMSNTSFGYKIMNLSYYYSLNKVRMYEMSRGLTRPYSDHHSGLNENPSATLIRLACCGRRGGSNAECWLVTRSSRMLGSIVCINRAHLDLFRDTRVLESKSQRKNRT